MDDGDVYEGQPVMWKGRKGYVIDTYRAQDGSMMAVVSVSPSSTGVGNNVKVKDLEEADE